MHNFKISIILAILSALVISCGAQKKKISDQDLITYKGKPSGQGASIEWPEKKLKKSFIKYWSNIYNGKLDKAYNSEAFHVQKMMDKRKFITYYKNAQVNELKGIEVQEVKKLSEYCYEIFSKFKIDKSVNQIENFYLTDRWVKLEGKWYHITRNKLFFPYLS